MYENSGPLKKKSKPSLALPAYFTHAEHRYYTGYPVYLTGYPVYLTGNPMKYSGLTGYAK